MAGFAPTQVRGFVMGPVFLLIVLILPAPEGMTAAAWMTAGIAGLMATWWMTEAIPIPATALLPLVLFPLVDAGSMRETASPFADPIIFLFLGGFLIALAMERWNLHRRIALNVIARVGTGPAALVGGFMLAAALISMWVSNTATALMMLPVALSVVQVAGAGGERGNFQVALLLGLAYGCNIGGMATLVGTPPNALLAGFMASEYGVTLSFANWLGVGLPIVAVGLPLAFVVLTRFTYPLSSRPVEGAAESVRAELAAMGRVSKQEWLVGFVFAVTALLWVTRPLLLNIVPSLSDAGIAMAAGVALFVIPSDFREGEFLMDWKTATRVPWGTLLLFGGGLSLAGAFTRTGLSTWIGESLAGLGGLPVILILLVVIVLVVFLTELTSNAATTATLLPVIAAMAIGIGQNPMLLAIPAVLSASCAFMLPVATPPNAIVFGSERVTIPQMARSGFWLNLCFIVLLTAAAYTLVMWVFGVQAGVVPDWAG
ncbi:MAG: DASS family sodium-coupled anion symporter [Rhodothermales bacterium]|nr:DASS family sodium-coupled anion symporter [Rhodothermales bacterium]